MSNLKPPYKEGHLHDVTAMDPVLTRIKHGGDPVMTPFFKGGETPVGA